MVAYQGAAAFKRISNIIDKEIKIKDQADSPKLILKNSDIKFNAVSFKYENTNEKAIKNVFKNRGKYNGCFVGHSGVEKSTIINLSDFMTHRRARLK